MEKYELFSQLRSIYETSEDYPHTLRVTITMQDMIDGGRLKEAVDLTMKRYPYYCIQLIREGERYFFIHNEREIPVRHANEIVTLGSEASNYHLLAFSWWKTKIHIDVWHSVLDGGALGRVFNTLLYYYCALYYGKPLSARNVLLSDSPVDQQEWQDPYLKDFGDTEGIRIRKWSGPALRIADNPRIHMTKRSITYNVRIPEKDFMQFNLSKDGSPGTLFALFLARSIDEVQPGHTDPIAIAMCLNQRKALRSPLAHESLVGCISLVYEERMKRLPFDTQVICFRGAVTLQSDSGPVLDEVKEYQRFMSEVEQLPSIAERRQVCHRAMMDRSARYTATISYVGKSSFGDSERYVREIDALPSAALPSIETPITVEVGAVNGFFFVNYIQSFGEQDYFDAFIRQLRAHDIHFRYDVLDRHEVRYPNIVLP